LLERAGLPTRLEAADWGLIIQRMAYDKKNVDSRIVFVLPTGYGKVEVFKDVAMDEVRWALTGREKKEGK